MANGKRYGPLDFWEVIGRMEAHVDELQSAEGLRWEDRGKAPTDGVYAIYEHGQPIYVGRSNKVRDRIYQHGAEGSDRNSASFAFRLLKEKLNVTAGKAEEIEAAHKNEFLRQKERVRSMTFRVVEIADDLEQHLFETYAVCKFGTSPEHNDFRNH